MQEVTSKEELAGIIENNEKVLIDFWAPWCGPCKMIAPIIGQISKEVTDVKVVKVNCDEAPEIATSYSVSAIPNIVILKNGEVKESIVSLQPKQKYIDAINNI
jgi:thioredoxin 1